MVASSWWPHWSISYLWKQSKYPLNLLLSYSAHIGFGRGEQTGLIPLFKPACQSSDALLVKIGFYIHRTLFKYEEGNQCQLTFRNRYLPVQGCQSLSVYLILVWHELERVESVNEVHPNLYREALHDWILRLRSKNIIWEMSKAPITFQTLFSAHRQEEKTDPHWVGQLSPDPLLFTLSPPRFLLTSPLLYLCLHSRFPLLSKDVRFLTQCRNASVELGLQERIVMEATIADAMANGRELPDDPAIRQVAEQLRQEKKVGGQVWEVLTVSQPNPYHVCSHWPNGQARQRTSQHAESLILED